MRRVLYFGATLSAFACSFPERTFIPADEFDEMKNAGGSAGVGGNAGSGASGAAGGSAGTGGMTTGGAAGVAGSGGEGGVAGTAGTGAAGSGGTSGEGGTGATTAGGTGGSAGNPTGGTGGSAGGGTGGTGGTGGSVTNGLIFSEYVEGSSFNKALEIYNAGSTAVDLGTCVLNKYVNAEVNPTPTGLSTTLQPGATYVVCNNQISDASQCDRLDSFISHNGNEAYGLVCDGALEDSIGQIGMGSPPGSKWGTAPYTTADQTLRRKCSISSGDTDLMDAYDPAAEWDSFAADDVSGLGTHCGSAD